MEAMTEQCGMPDDRMEAMTEHTTHAELLI
jgi:hypothetical protein